MTLGFCLRKSGRWSQVLSCTREPWDASVPSRHLYSSSNCWAPVCCVGCWPQPCPLDLPPSTTCAPTPVLITENRPRDPWKPNQTLACFLISFRPRNLGVKEPLTGVTVAVGGAGVFADSAQWSLEKLRESWNLFEEVEIKSYLIFFF